MGEQLLRAKAEVAEPKAEIKIKDAALEAKDVALQSKDAVIEAKDAFIRRLQSEVQDDALAAAGAAHCISARAICDCGAAAPASSTDKAAAAARIAAKTPTDIFDAAYRGDLWLVADHVTVDPTCARARHRGWTPIHYSVNNVDIRMCELLLRSGADVTAKNSRGWTPLHCSACNGDVGICQLLSSSGADVNAKCNSGCTPLFVAACNGHLYACHVLVDHGADLTLRDSDGITALNIAIKTDSADVVAYLRRIGAPE